MESVFTIRRSERHDKTRARIARGYTASYLRSGEPLIDQCTEMFIRAMDDLLNTPVDLGEWVQWYAFDVIGLVNFGNTFGFMETRRDPYKIIQNLDNTTEVGTALGYLPEIHWTLQRLTLGPKGKGILDLPPFADANPIPVIMDMVTTAMARYPEHTDEKRADFLAFMRSEQAKRPERLSDFDIISHLTSNWYVFLFFYLFCY
jgi:cytochrome P450